MKTLRYPKSGNFWSKFEVKNWLRLKFEVNSNYLINRTENKLSYFFFDVADKQSCILCNKVGRYNLVIENVLILRLKDPDIKLLKS